VSPSFSTEEYSGKKIGSFIVREKIGQGGMAIVFRGESTVDGEEVAIKVMHPSLKAEPQCIKRIFREADIASKLKHKNIVRVYAVERINGLVALIMYFVKGRSLYLIEQDEGPLPLKKAIPIMRGVLAGLKFAHSKKVIHRDLKPENVLITEDGTPLLADFGIAKPLEATKLTQTGQSLGTPYYMSPEQIRGKADIDYRSDIYSAGILFYELLTGKVPFEGNDPVTISYSHIHNAPVVPSSMVANLSSQVDLFILKAMEKEREHRFQTVEEMECALERLANNQPLEIELNMVVAKVSKNSGDSISSLVVMVCLAVATFVILLMLVFEDHKYIKHFWTKISSVTGNLSKEQSSVSFKVSSCIKAENYAELFKYLDGIDKDSGAGSSEKKKLANIIYLDGNRRFVEGKNKLALLLFKRSFSYDLKRADTSFQLAKVYMKLGNFPMAAKFFGQTMRILEPSKASDFIKKNESIYFSQLPKVELASIGIDLYLVGNRLYLDNKFDEALLILRKALHYKSSQPDVHKLLYYIYKEKKSDKADYHRRKYAEKVENK